MLSASFCASFPEQQHVVTKFHTNITPLSKHSVCNTLKSVITHNMADTRTKNSGALVTEATDVFVSWNFVGRQRLEKLWNTVNALSVHCQCTVNALSMYCQCTVNALLMHFQCTITALSMHCQCTVNKLSMHCQCTVNALSMHCQCTVNALSMHC